MAFASPASPAAQISATYAAWTGCNAFKGYFAAQPFAHRFSHEMSIFDKSGKEWRTVELDEEAVRCKGES